MSGPLPPSKADLRTLYATRRAAVSDDDRLAMTSALWAHLFSLPAWTSAPLIVGYASIRGELDLTPVWQAAIAAGKTYALPCTVTDAREGQMLFRRLSAFDPAALIPGRYGIPEPPADHPILAPADLDGALMLVPGLAFDREGFRIGYGGGYYDRFLAPLRTSEVCITTVGAAFSCCQADALPHDPHDIPVDIIISERRILPRHGTE